VSILASAGVPHAAVPHLDAPPGGLLIVPAPNAHATLLDRLGPDDPILTGPPPYDVLSALDAVRDALGALVRPDLRGVMVLRLDDPGAAVRAHLDSWRHPPVTPDSWNALWDALRPLGRASVFCCPGWVCPDGEVRPSRQVNPSEWEALDAAVDAGLVDLECHGFTHLHPDTRAWAVAPDRSSAPEWYRELWPPRELQEPAVGLQASIIARWQEACGPGTTLVAPGEAWGLGSIAAARRQGLRLFNSWSVCRLDLPTPVWAAGIGSPYLDEPHPSWLEAGLPVIGYWHDRDMAVHGPRWVPEQLDKWLDCGVRHTWAFADLARAYAEPIDAVLVDGEIVVRRAPAGLPLRTELSPTAAR
jgi:hypothetical protein